jgi:hypothetical protein
VEERQRTQAHLWLQVAFLGVYARFWPGALSSSCHVITYNILSGITRRRDDETVMGKSSDFFHGQVVHHRTCFKLCDGWMFIEMIRHQ